MYPHDIGTRPSKGLGVFGASASALLAFQGRLGPTGWVVGQPDMEEEADQHESDHEELVKQRIRYRESGLVEAPQPENQQQQQDDESTDERIKIRSNRMISPSNQVENELIIPRFDPA